MLSEARQVQELIQLHNLPANLAVNPYTYVDYQVRFQKKWSNGNPFIVFSFFELLVHLKI